MTVNRKQESNPRAVLVNPLKLYNDLVGGWWLRNVRLTAQSSSCWTRLLLADFQPLGSFGSQSPVTAAATPAVPAPHQRAPFRSLHHSPEVSSDPPGRCFPPSAPQHYQTTRLPEGIAAALH